MFCETDSQAAVKCLIDQKLIVFTRNFKNDKKRQQLWLMLSYIFLYAFAKEQCRKIWPLNSGTFPSSILFEPLQDCCY